MADQNTIPFPITVALMHEDRFGVKILRDSMEKLFSVSQIRLGRGDVVLIKPNLLRSHALTCTPPDIVVCLAKILLDLGCRVKISDSPGFGLAHAVAYETGLLNELAKLDLDLVPMNRSQWISVSLTERSVKIPVSRTALEVDKIISVPRLKAHSQMRLTAAVKNLYGTIPGIHKAILHTLYGKDRDVFADLIGALYELLPPCAAICDARIAMHITGPSGGKPYPLGLLAASDSAVALDESILEILHCDISRSPLALALERRQAYGCKSLGYERVYPLEKPDDFSSKDFILPEHLLTASFAPHRLMVSICRRMYAAVKSRFQFSSH